MASLVQVTEPAVEPLVFNDFSDFVRLNSAAESAITALIPVARMYAELMTQRALIERQFKLSFVDGFPCYPSRKNPEEIRLPMGQLKSVDEIGYVDTEGDSQTLTEGVDFEVDSSVEPATVRPLEGKSWPITKEQYGAAWITFTAGYGDAGSDVDPIIRMAMMQYLADLWENPQTQTLTIAGAHSLPAASKRVHALLMTRRLLGAAV